MFDLLTVFVLSLFSVSKQRRRAIEALEARATVVLIGLYFLKCTRYDQLILRKIIKIVATRCQILTVKCTKIDFGWGSAPDPAGGAYSALPDPLAGFKGTLRRRIAYIFFGPS